MVWGSDPSKCRRSSSLPKCPRPALGRPSLLYYGYPYTFQGESGQGMKLTTHVTLVLELRMCGAIPLLCLHAFMVWTGTTLPLFLFLECKMTVYEMNSFHNLQFSWQCLYCTCIILCMMLSLSDSPHLLFFRWWIRTKLSFSTVELLLLDYLCLKTLLVTCLMTLKIIYLPIFWRHAFIITNFIL